MSSGFANDPHSEQGFACPGNLFGIKDDRELQALEGPLVTNRGGELIDKPTEGKFDSAHLRAIHKYRLQDIFPWAGEFRVVDISKGTSSFGPALYIARALEDALGRLQRENLLTGLAPRVFAQRAAFHLGEINAMHPFREGHGRARREFIRQLALLAGHPLSWSGFTLQRRVDASILSHLKSDCAALALILEEALYSTRNGVPA